MNIESSFDPHTSNIDRYIDEPWLRGVYRNSRFLLKFSVSSLIIDCRHGQSHVNWNVSHRYRVVFLWFHVCLTFQSCIRNYDWFTTYLCRMLFKITQEITQEPIHGYHQSEMTQNEVVRSKILTDGTNRWSDEINGDDFDRQFDWKIIWMKFITVGLQYNHVSGTKKSWKS
jgi:hypothetical protein